ncbi:hypothetical protein CEXT_551401 [Caerostris extrusa]|uniref:Uncharacterized protein n=1 Tax=Caerostris extrusa TaxID=172846 RepID=A0AAV4UP75_CAEEX|nr:hypothetical protein CEXT_551401 [Caerostris extrusa]
MAPPPSHCEANNSAHCLSFVGIHLQTIPLMRTPPTVNGFHAANAAKLFPSLVAGYYPQMVLHASHCATPEEKKKSPQSRKKKLFVRSNLINGFSLEKSVVTAITIHSARHLPLNQKYLIFGACNRVFELDSSYFMPYSLICRYICKNHLIFHAIISYI